VHDLDDNGENPNVPWAAGALISDAHDISRFFSALLSGRLMSKGLLAQMKQTVVVDHELGDGLGIFSSQLPCGRFWGHEGGILNYATIVAASDNGNRVAVISARGGALSGSPPDTAALLCSTDTTNSR
jgi:D-alanyl-D-alanine carboxypeptidase